jgi:hypothetical protein
MNKKFRMLIGAILFGILVTSGAIASSPEIRSSETAFAATHDDRTDSRATDAITTHATATHVEESSIPPKSQTELESALRALWVDHVVWTRMYIVSFVAGMPDTDAVAQRLLTNQENIGDAIKPYYGEQAGKKLTALLKGHILVAVDLLNAAKDGDSIATRVAEEKWYQNADSIATFLSNANPNWSKKELTNMLDEHLSLTKAEAVARLTGNYSADIAAFDQIHEHANGMSVAIADGIAKQFPEQFSVSVADKPVNPVTATE